jgi:hypothetical protein
VGEQSSVQSRQGAQTVTPARGFLPRSIWDGNAHSSVDHPDCADRVAREVRCEEGRYVRDLGGVGSTVDRCAFSVLHQIVWITEDVGYHLADAKRVNPDPVSMPSKAAVRVNCASAPLDAA